MSWRRWSGALVGLQRTWSASCCVRRWRTRLTAPPLVSPRVVGRKALGRRASPHRASPSENLLSPFGAVLQGSSRGPQASFAEPLDAWLTVLADSVPFYKECLVVCPSTASAAQVQRVWDRCREHIPTAHVGSMAQRTQAAPPRSDISFSPGAALPAPASLPQSRSTSPAVPAAHSALTLSPGNAVAQASSRSTRPLPALRSPLEAVTAGSLDLVVLAGNVFAHEMLFDAPWHLSHAHRVLRPHGVVAIVGHAAETEVTAPAWAAEDAGGYLESSHLDAQECLRMAAAAATAACEGDDVAPVQALRRAVEVHETLRSGHADVFLPFPSVRRRWFTSEYAMTPAALVAHYRAAPLYQALHSPAGELWWRTMQHRQEAADRAPDSFFVDVTGPLWNEQHTAPSGDSSGDDPDVASLAAWSPTGVRRRRSAADPLDVLQAILDAQVAASGGSAAPSRAPLRVHAQHFVVTCSARSMNAAPPTDGSFGRVPGTRPRPALPAHDPSAIPR